MHSFIKINPIEKDRYCERIYKEYISETSDFLTSCEEAGEILRTYIPVACYTNFRDALFHFRKMVQSNEEYMLECQAFAVTEHSNRAKTDAIISIFDYCYRVLDVILPKCPHIGKEISCMKNNLKQHILFLRLSGIMLESSKILRPTDEQIMKLLFDFFDFVYEHIEEEIFFYAIKSLKSNE